MRPSRMSLHLAALAGLTTYFFLLPMIPIAWWPAKELLPCNTCTPATYARGCFNPYTTKRVVSFALYKVPGSPESSLSLYALGMLQNLRLMRLNFPGWRMRISIRFVPGILSNATPLCGSDRGVLRLRYVLGTSNSPWFFLHDDYGMRRRLNDNTGICPAPAHHIIYMQ